MGHDIAWRGRTVHTGFGKEPVKLPHIVCRVAFVYQMGSHRYLQRHFGRSNFVYDQFGVNYTVDRLSDAKVVSTTAD